MIIKEVLERDVPPSSRIAAQTAIQRCRILLNFRYPIEVRWYLFPRDSDFACESGKIINAPWSENIRTQCEGYAVSYGTNRNEIWLHATHKADWISTITYHEMAHQRDFMFSRSLRSDSEIADSIILNSETVATRFQSQHAVEARFVARQAIEKGTAFDSGSGCGHYCQCQKILAREKFAVDFVASTDEKAGSFKGIASVFDSKTESEPASVIVHGAFRKTLQAWHAGLTRKIPILWQHFTDMPIGRLTDAYESTRGLEVKGKLGHTQRAREALILLKDGVISGLSIGFNIKDAELRTHFDGSVVRHIKEVELWEISLVTFGADPGARIEQICEQNLCQHTT